MKGYPRFMTNFMKNSLDFNRINVYLDFEYLSSSARLKKKKKDTHHPKLYKSGTKFKSGIKSWNNMI
jgi:hypothetical protein